MTTTTTPIRLTHGTMQDVLPEGSHGVAAIEHFMVSKDDEEFSRVRFVVTQGRDRPVDQGSYVRLKVNGRLYMSDTRAETESNRRVVHQARGNVLIAGLGIGLIILPIARKPEVNRVVVVEKHPDVVALVEPHIRKALGDDAHKLVVVVADINTWLPPKNRRFDTIYFDIWGDISSDQIAEMETLHERFRPFARKASGKHIPWVNSWQYDYLLARYRPDLDDDEDDDDEEDFWEDEDEDDCD